MAKFFRALFHADSFSGNLTLYSLATIGFRGLGLLRMILLAWILGPAMFGLASLGLAFADVASSLALLGIPSALERYIPLHQNSHSLKAFLRQVIPLSLALLALAIILLLLNIKPISSAVFSLTSRGPLSADYLAGFSQLAGACIAAILASACFYLVVSCLKGLRLFRAVAALELTYSLLFTVLAVILLLGYLRQPAVVLVAQALSMALTSAIVGLAVFFTIHSSTDQGQALPSNEYLSRFTSFAAWGLPGTITWRLLQVFPLWYLNRTLGLEITGTYSAYFSIVSGVFFLSVPFWSVMNIHVVRHWVQAKYDLARATVEKSFRAFSLALLLVCLALTFAAPFLRWLFPSSFASGAYYVRFLCLPSLLAANFGLVHLLAHLLERPGLRVLALACGTAATLISGYFFIPAYAITGAALCAALGLTLATVLGLVMLASRRCYISLPSWIVLACPILLLIPNHYLLTASFAALLLLAVFSPWFFSRQDKQWLFDHVRDALKRYWPKKAWP